MKMPVISTKTELNLLNISTSTLKIIVPIAKARPSSIDRRHYNPYICTQYNLQEWLCFHQQQKQQSRYLNDLIRLHHKLIDALLIIEKRILIHTIMILIDRAQQLLTSILYKVMTVKMWKNYWVEQLLAFKTSQYLTAVAIQNAETRNWTFKQVSLLSTILQTRWNQTWIYL